MTAEASSPSPDPEMVAAAPRAYLPPFRQLLNVLAITDYQLQSTTLTVPTRALAALLTEALRTIQVDEPWYLERYPDVHASLLSGDIVSASKHFRDSGYREGTLPRRPPFDASYYFSTYKDLARAFDSADVAGLRHHYESAGYQEGRAGVPEHSQDAERRRLGLTART